MSHIPHIHKIGDFHTSTEILSPIDSEMHFHAIGDTFTSVDPFGPGHIHTINGDSTGGPIDIILTRDALEGLEEDEEDGGGEDDEKRRDRNNY